MNPFQLLSRWSDKASSLINQAGSHYGELYYKMCGRIFFVEIMHSPGSGRHNKGSLVQ